MATHKVRPDLGSVEAEESSQRRARRSRMYDALAIVAGIVIVAAIGVQAVFVASDPAEPDTGAEPAQIRPAVTGPADTESTFNQPGTGGHLEPGESLPAESAPAFVVPDVVGQKQCRGDARSGLELTELRAGIRVRYELHQSPGGDEWLIAIRPLGVAGPHPDPPIFRGIRVAGASGHLAVQLRARRNMAPFPSPFGAVAVDRQTGQVCRVEAALPGD